MNRIFPDVRSGINALCDGSSRVTRILRARGISPWYLSGIVGGAAAIALGAWLIRGRDIPSILLVAVPAVHALTFFAIRALVRWRTGSARTVLFEQMSVAALSATGLFALAKVPRILSALDVWTLSMTLFLAWGRIGCFLSGCCHGRAGAVGMRSSVTFPGVFFEIRLFPLQLVESLLLVVVLFFGLLLATGEPPSGTSLAWCLAAYSAGRFGLEFFRGDSARPYWRGLSESQWFCCGTTLLLWGIGLAGWGPRGFLWAGAAAITCIGTSAVFARRLLGPHRLYPTPVAPLKELAELVEDLTAQAWGHAESRPVRLTGRTRQGVRIACEIDPGGELFHIAHDSGGMDESSAWLAARIVCAVRGGEWEEGSFSREGDRHVLRWTFPNPEPAPATARTSPLP